MKLPTVNLPPLRLRIAAKLVLLLAAFSIFTAGLAGYYTYASSRTLLLREAERDIQTATQVLGRHFQSSLEDVARDAHLLALEAGRRFDEGNRNEQLAAVFSDLMTLNPQYFQVRLIDADPAGTELVRIDRDEQWLTQVQGLNLQEKGHMPYVLETRGLDSDAVYFSPISINREQGAHAGLNKPALRVVTPVVNRLGERLGLIVINVDLNGLFTLLKADLPKAHGLYLANDQGDFLLHPDAQQAFGFDTGRRILIQESFPATQKLLGIKPEAQLINLTADGGAESLIASFIRLPFGSTELHRSVVLGLGEPRQHVLAETRALGISIVQLVIGFSLLAVVLAIFVARAVTIPLKQMVNSAHTFARDNSISELPTEREDELGDLARSLEDMQHKMLQQLNELKEKRLAMTHLARHDALTGLPNRRMFFDLLDRAIANARRSGQQLAIVFVDLDHFKQINDELGHATGDAVLKGVAAMLKSSVREVDTVARLGGDEFIVLFDRIADNEHMHVIVEKLHAAFQQPLQIGETTMQIHASIGISRFPVDGADSAQLVHNADLAMYRSKRSGRNTFQFHETPVENESDTA